MATTTMIEYQKLGAIVENVQAAQAEVTRAFDLLHQAKERLTATIGHAPCYYDSLWQHNINDFNLRGKSTESVTHIRKNAWRYVVKLIGVREYMTDARKKALDAQIEKGDLPDFTVDNILSAGACWTLQTPQLLQESLQEVYDWLRPRHTRGVGALKTNHTFKIGPKVIIGGAVERPWPGASFRISHYRENDFRSLGNVFSLLDGQGVQYYPEDFVTRFTHSMQENPAASCYCDAYFQCKAFANGHLHITFRRGDLVEALNRMAGEMALQEPGKEAR